jgi:phage tail-like protein
MSQGISPALSLRFFVKLDGLDNCYFTACEGLGAYYETENWAEGGSTSTSTLPVRLVYSNVRLSRPVDRDSGRVAAWFSGIQREWKRVDAAITVADGNGIPVAIWALKGIWPVRYTGPQLRADGTGVAIETIELSYQEYEVTPA